jgi:hypothetical protein
MNERSDARKNPMTRGQKRLLRLVYGLGGILVLMFFFVMAAIIYQLVHLK